MKFELFIARRLRLKSGKSTGKRSPSVTIAVAGIALAIVIMMIAIVVVLGFKHEIRDKVMGFDAQINIMPASVYSNSDNRFIVYNDTLRDLISSTLPQNAEISLSIKQPGILKTDSDFMGVILKGMDNGYNWKFVSDNLAEGKIPDYSCDENKNSIIISRIMSASLGLDVGDRIYAYFFNDNNIRTRRFEIAGIYESHFGEYDRITAFAPIEALQKISRLQSDMGSSIEIRGLNPDKIMDNCIALQENIAEACYRQGLSQMYQIDNVYHTGALYFNWLDLLDTNVVVILILMAFVSGFTLVSSMFIIILERINMIGVLKSLGASNAQIRRIFIMLTERLVLKGMLFGNIIALSLIFIQSKFHILPLDPEAYYLNYVPVEINWWHIVALNVGVIIISALILVLPSHLVSTISPAKTIRYE